jgi:hypothetical protein
MYGTGHDERRGRARRAAIFGGVNLKAVKKVGVLPVAISQVEVLERVIKSHIFALVLNVFPLSTPKFSIQLIHSSSGKMKGPKTLTIVIKLGEPLHFLCSARLMSCRNKLDCG